MPRRCPVCQSINYDDSEGAVCINCGTELPPLEEAGIELDEEETEENEEGGFYCPDCGSFVPNGEDKCDFCGRSFEDGIPLEDTMVTGLEGLEELAAVEEEFREEMEDEMRKENARGEDEGMEPDGIEENKEEINNEPAEEEVYYGEEIEIPEQGEEEEEVGSREEETYEETAEEEVEEYPEYPEVEEDILEEMGIQTEEDIEKVETPEHYEEAESESAKEEEALIEADTDKEETSYNPGPEPSPPETKKRRGKSKKEKKEKKPRKKRVKDEEEEEDEDEIPKEGGIYYKLSPISLTILAFLMVFLLAEFIMVIFNISLYVPAMLLSLSPIIGGSVIEAALFIAVALSTIDVALHYWDKKTNLWVSLVVTFIMILSLGINIATSAGAISTDLLSQFLLLGILGAVFIMDFLCILNYPDVLIDPGRENLEAFLESRSEIEQIIEEEEEKLRMKEQEVEEIKSQIELLSQQIEEEEEKLRIKDEEIAAISSQLEQVHEQLMEEEEKLRVRDEELDTLVQQELEKREQEMLLEEEEKLRMKEEENIRIRNDLEIQKKLHEEAREKLRMKEQELMTLRTELEKQIRERLEEEERLKLMETAARLEQMEKKKRILFPFTAIVGQEKMKRALILNAIYPEIGGVLIRGQKGTGKSVSVRALAEVLPDIEVTGCRFNCDPSDPENFCTECKMRAEKNMLQRFVRPVQVVDLPLNITEDRLIGSIDIEKVLREGTRSFEPGILAEVHRGILYVDEINLLDDYIVDILLDSASSGRVTIEREGISITHPSKFIIVGSMNPEEGELRPQILDRIALQTDVIGIHDVDKRIEIIKRREEFTTDPDGFREKFKPAQEELKRKITEARDRLKNVTTPERIYNLIGQICLDFDVDGHRADIIIERAARANAALEGRLETTAEDVIIAAEMALPHRMRRRPYEGEEFNIEVLRRWVSKRELERE